MIFLISYDLQQFRPVRLLLNTLIQNMPLHFCSFRW